MRGRIPVSATLVSQKKLQVVAKMVCVGEGEMSVAAWQATLCTLFEKRYPQERINIVAVQTAGGAEVDSDFLLSDILGRHEEPELIVIVEDAGIHLQQWQSTMGRSSQLLASLTPTKPTPIKSDGLSAKARADLLRDGRTASSAHVPPGSISKLRKSPLSQDTIKLIREDIARSELHPALSTSLKRKRSPSSEHDSTREPSGTNCSAQASSGGSRTPKMQTTRNLTQTEHAKTITAAECESSLVSPQKKGYADSLSLIPDDMTSNPSNQTVRRAAGAIWPSETNSLTLPVPTTCTPDQAIHEFKASEHQLPQQNTLSQRDATSDDANSDDLARFMSSDGDDDDDDNRAVRDNRQSGEAIPERRQGEVRKGSSPGTPHTNGHFAWRRSKSGSRSPHGSNAESTTLPEDLLLPETDGESMASKDLSDSSSSRSETGSAAAWTSVNLVAREKCELSEKDAQQVQRKRSESVGARAASRQSPGDNHDARGSEATPSGSLRHARPSLVTRPFKSLSWLANQPVQRAKGELRSGDESLPVLAVGDKSPLAGSHLSTKGASAISSSESTSSESDSEDSSLNNDGDLSDAGLPASKKASATNSPARSEAHIKKSRGVRGLLG
ncbi:hypothetical protein BCR37DRAFT_303078 [Protomyces lactucae-debilis]|uniref:Uncharacterized protein n=1 Tax=Protomyces lactucae-debilis TaxID=2754530 RepID=A0A1Y2FGB9_PROLT|nr:uncharacterized protein BCR37DRAFT_303078 [Protomyces lactucae-debilis]ORY82464.1 hypothetical protein BCR37DRAFT_303078 [Protomyces lactucae-debilis]